MADEVSGDFKVFRVCVHVFVQPAGAGWEGHHALRFPKSALLGGTYVKHHSRLCNVVLFGYGIPLMDPDAGRDGDTNEEESNAKERDCDDSDAEKKDYRCRKAVRIG